ncbi:Gfo/Idh/MocA family oxidoreductase [Phycisphaeraceae bacterium D3-23]
MVLLMGCSVPARAQPTAEPEPVPAAAAPPVRVVVIGATHAHVHWVLNEAARGRDDFELVGVYEPDEDLAGRLLRQHNLDPAIHFTDLDAMFDQTDPEAACLFGSIFDHREHTIFAAERGAHVMVEKPLAVSMEHARAMADAAEQHGVHLLTNYETTWYPSNHAVRAMAEDGTLGELRRIVVHMGHPGPREIGCSEEFLAWLTDPVLNGGGALTDFGCYGANLATWLMDGQRPVAVTAVTQQIKPDVYPNVDDEATIVIEYPDAVAIVQASWNWTVNRKDIAVYGTADYVQTIGNSGTRLGDLGGAADDAESHPPLAEPTHDPFAYLAAVARGELEPGGLSGVENNLLVVEILDAARKSAAEGVRVELAGPGE